MAELTSKEKLVFYGISKWPELSDEDLSKKIDVKRPTVTAIRNKLLKERFYTLHNLPDLYKIGCELMVTRYGDFNPLTPWSKRAKYASKEPELFYRISTDTSRVSIVAARNFTEIKKYLDTAATRHGSHGFLTPYGVEHVFQPYGLTKRFVFFDFAPLLNKNFELGFSEKKELDYDFSEYKPANLSSTEKMVLYALVKYPEMKDKEIAEKISMTRQTVNNVRQKLFSTGLVKTVIFPDLNKLGFELVVLSHMTYTPESTVKKSKECIKEIVSEGSNYVIAYSDMESVKLSAFKNYTSFESTWDNIMSSYTKCGITVKNATIKLYPTCDIRNHMMLRCDPLVKKILNIEKEI